MERFLVQYQTTRPPHGENLTRDCATLDEAKEAADALLGRDDDYRQEIYDSETGRTLVRSDANSKWLVLKEKYTATQEEARSGILHPAHDYEDEGEAE